MKDKLKEIEEYTPTQMVLKLENSENKHFREGGHLFLEKFFITEHKVHRSILRKICPIRYLKVTSYHENILL